MSRTRRQIKSPVQVLIDLATPAEIFDAVEKAVAAHFKANPTEYVQSYIHISSFAVFFFVAPCVFFADPRFIMPYFLTFIELVILHGSSMPMRMKQFHMWRIPLAGIQGSICASPMPRPTPSSIPFASSGSTRTQARSQPLPLWTSMSAAASYMD